jgi:glutathione reductase (NADPH)
MLQLLDEHHLVVDGEQYYGENIVIATGQHSNKLDIEGSEYTHDNLIVMLANSILIIPTPINVILFGICSKDKKSLLSCVYSEFASITIKSGVETHMIHVDDEPLKGFYSAHIAKLMDKL